MTEEQAEYRADMECTDCHHVDTNICRMCEKMHLFFPKGRVVAQCAASPDEHELEVANGYLFGHECEDCNHHETDCDDEPCSECYECSEFVQKHTIKKNDHPVPDLVNHPAHYTSHPREVIDVIRDQLLVEYGLDGFRAYCWGNEIKYRMRAGLKGDAAQDIGKAMKYKEFREALDEH